MNIIIIGSKGFIGSHMTNFLSSVGKYEVYECDVMVDYEKSNYYLLDATNADYNRIFSDKVFDVCINCSGAASVLDSIKNPLRDFTLNTYNVFKLLDSIRLNQPNCKFINISSAAVYGNPSILPISENLPLDPISPYGLHKMHAEHICKAFFTYYNIPTCSLRVFSAYGPGLKKQLFWDIYQKAKKADIINMFGTGKETRDFIYIDDVLKAVLFCFNNSKFEGDTINIANGEEVTISSAVQILLSLFPYEKKVVFNGLIKEGDPLNWRADITILKSMGYKKSVDLSQGLKNYFEWIHNH